MVQGAVGPSPFLDEERQLTADQAVKISKYADGMTTTKRWASQASGLLSFAASDCAFGSIGQHVRKPLEDRDSNL